MKIIHSIKIHPSIGIARIGDAENIGKPISERDDFFVGPICPGIPPEPKGGYKTNGKIKKQAAEFRLFAYDAKGHLIKEITSKDAEISWRVSLANKKASWFKFEGQKVGVHRNINVKGDDREKLNICPSAQSLKGANQGPVEFNDGTFTAYHSKTNKSKTIPVRLGEAMTNDKGRLWVLGGQGKSSSPFQAPITTYANNDGWCDDVSDGPIDATVTLNDGTTLEALGAWLICSIPKYAPQLQNYITLHDMLHNEAIKRGLMEPPLKTEFYRDVLPFLNRIIKTRWTMGIGPAHDFDVTYAADPNSTKKQRMNIFSRLRDPRGGNIGIMNMPMLLDDNNQWRRSGNEGLAITAVQYDHLKRWAHMESTVGKPPSNPKVTPEGMDQASLENCCGGAFFPGMEASWMLRDTFAYSEPYRIARIQPSSATGMMEPGDVTKQMAVPWQADFLECRRNEEKPYLPGWWPQQRPEMVTEYGDAVPLQWTRGIGWLDHLSMVENWAKLGFILKRSGGYYETDRGQISPPQTPRYDV